MAVDINTVENIARLARLDFPAHDIATFTEQFNTILTYIDKLNELDTSHVEPLTQVTATTNVMREDEPGACLTPDDALRNAPARLENFIKVPKVVDDKGTA